MTNGHHHQGRSSESLLDKEAILGALRFFPGQIILDAGCGNGYMSKEFAGFVAPEGKVYALDPDEKAIEILKRETEDSNIIALLGDITKPIGLEESSVDLIYVSTVLHGFSRSQMESFQEEVNRLLKPHGILAIIEIKKEPTPFGPPLEIRFSPQELKETMSLTPKKTLELGPYFYLQTFEKEE